MLNYSLIAHYKCPVEVGRYLPAEKLSSALGYFRFGDDLICYGQCACGHPSPSPTGPVCDVADSVSSRGGLPQFPFDPGHVIENLRMERYATHSHGNAFRRIAATIAREAYYGVRPGLPLAIRKVLQKTYLQGRIHRPFPRWPVDSSVEAILENLLAATLQASGADNVPFIWFWPDGAPACVVMTHDVETGFGREFCSPLMDIDDAYGVRASFQIVPQRRYRVPENFLQGIRERGFEINIQDLNHDGLLFSSRERFLRRARLINQYGREYGAEGFRSAVLYRRPDWFDALEFRYDMSIPNVAHMDPQLGGCCSVFPYFIGDILELPVTTIQDYTLFHILGEYSTEMWKQQLDLIMQRYGLASFIVHPDYIMEQRAREIYRQLLSYLTTLAAEHNIWLALPGEVNRWWRDRNQMTLVEHDDGWRIEGPGKEHARIAYATLGPDGGVQYTIGSSPGKRDQGSQASFQIAKSNLSHE